MPARATKPKEKSLSGFIKYYIKLVNPYLSDGDIDQIATSLLKWTKDRGVNLFSCMAIMQRESSFYPNPPGSTISKGLFQLTRYALDELVNKGYIKNYDWDKLTDIDYNISLGTLYYLYCARLAKNNRREAIARYRKTSNPDSPTAQAYASSVLKIRDKIVQEYQKYKNTGGVK